MQTYVKFLDDATRTMKGYSNPDVKRPDHVGTDNLENVLVFVQTVKGLSAAVSHVSYLSSEPVTNTFSYSITKNGDGKGFTLKVCYGDNCGLSETFDTEQLAKASILKLRTSLVLNIHDEKAKTYFEKKAAAAAENKHEPSFERMEKFYKDPGGRA
tara:strand:+ start:2542 stop:3009 length:468 start_codon:yes stop_codon:yes gene_type:complete